MMINKRQIFRIFIIVACGALSACASSRHKGEETLETLENRSVKVNPQSLPTANKEDARKQYQEFLARTNNQELRAAAMERLADIELERKQTKQFADAELKDAEKRARKNVPAPATEKAESGNFSSVAQQYEKLIKRYPNSKENEKLYYQLARAYDLSGQLDKELDVLNRLTNDFPDNKHSEEVQFRRGELYFSLNKYKDAERAYSYVLSNKDSPLYERSIYKHGWALFKQNQLQQARYSFYRLLDLHFTGNRRYEDFARAEKELIDDTFRVVSLTYSFEDGVTTLKSFSKLYGHRTYEYRIYRELGNLFIKQERFEDASNVFASYAEVYPNSREAPLFLVEVIKIYQHGGFSEKLSTAKADLVTRYAIGKPFWDRHDKALQDELYPIIKTNLQELARHYHARAQKSKKPSDYSVAAHWYRQYVQSFPSDKETPHMNFLLAEDLSESGDFEAAAKEYQKTAYSYGNHKDSAEAGYAVLLTQQKMLAASSGDKRAVKRNQAVDVALQFGKSFPDDKRTPSVLLKAAEELVELKRLEEASQVAQQLVALNKRKSLDVNILASAWAIVATAEYDLAHYANAEQATLARLRLNLPNDKDRKTHVERLAAAIYKQGEEAKQQGNLKQAAEHFLRIGQLAPSATIVSNAQYDAAAAMAEAEDWKGTIAILTSFLRNYPDHKFAQGATEKLAFAYEKDNNWSAAAQTYDKLYGSEKDPQRKKDMLWQMAEFYDKSKDEKSAVRIYQRYVEDFPKPLEQATEARQKIADYYKGIGDLKARNSWLQQIVSANEKGSSSPRTQFLAAKASLELAEPIFQSYRDIQLVQPLKKNLKRKKSAMKEVIDVYTRAANYGVAEVTTASTYRIAEVYNDFSHDLFSSERPKGLSKEELEQYNLLLEEQAFPFEEKAIEIHETNADRVKTGVYDEWVKKSFLQLRKLQPVRYSKLERSELFDVGLE